MLVMTFVLQSTAMVDWGAILQQVGPWGVVVLVVADFIFNQVRVNRIRVNMEKDNEDRLNDSTRKLIEIMDARLAERDKRISELQEENRLQREENRSLRTELSEASGKVASLNDRLDWTNTQLVQAREQAALVPTLADQVSSLKRQTESLNNDLIVERDLREKSEFARENLQSWYNRLEADHQALIKKNNRLGMRLDEQTKQMTQIEEDRRHLSEKLSQLMVRAGKDDLPDAQEAQSIDDGE